MQQQVNRNARKLIRENIELILTEKKGKKGLIAAILATLGLGGYGGFKLAGGENFMKTLAKGALIGGATYGGVQHLKTKKAKAELAAIKAKRKEKEQTERETKFAIGEGKI